MRAMLLLALAFVAVQADAWAQQGSIQGNVVDDQSNGPVAGVRVSAHAGGSIKASWTTQTNSGGSFNLTGLAAGTYSLRFEHEGYVIHFLGEKEIPGGMNVISMIVAPGQAVKDVLMRLIPTGTISGRVLDIDGRPLSNVPIGLYSNKYWGNGRKTISAVGAPNLQTNDRGEYRVAGIEPGRYYLSAGPHAANTGIGLTYYPGASRPDDAQAIDVRPGAEATGFNFTMSIKPRYRVHGRVVDEQTGQPPSDAWISVNFSNLMIPMRSLNGGPSYDSRTGNFETPGLPPGEHVIAAQVTGAQTPCDKVRSAGTGITFITPDGMPNLLAGGTAAVKVENADVEGVVITVRQAGCLMGNVSTDGARLPGIWFDLTSTENSFHQKTAQVFGGGSLTADGLAPGEYHVGPFRHPSGFFVKAATYNGVDVLSQPLHFNATSSGRLQILLSSKVAGLEGKVTNAGSQPASRVYVVLIPDKMRHRSELYATTLTQKDGTYRFESVTPGDYKIFAWEAIEAFSWFDAEVLRRYEPRGKPIRLEESSKRTVDLSVIAAGQ